MNDHSFEIDANTLIAIAPDGKLRISSTTPLTVELAKTTIYPNTQYMPKTTDLDASACTPV